MIKKTGFLVLFLLVFHFGGKLCNRATDGFSVAELTSNTPLAYETLGSEDEARTILNQPFTYLGKGGQSFVFASQDGRYVLKFFNNHPKPWILLDKYRAKKMQKLNDAYSGYRLAFQQIPNECGLIFLHFNKSDFHAPSVTLIDKLHIAHTVDPNGLEFALQKRAQPLADALKIHPHETLLAVKQLVVLLCEKNIHDQDPRIYRNIGLINGKAIVIDPGKFALAYGREPKLPLKFRSWIDANFPELSEEAQ